MRKQYKRRYNFFVFINRIWVGLFIRLFRMFKPLNKYKAKKNEPVLVLANHQTDLDPIFVHFSFNKALCPVATDTLMSNGFISRLLGYTFGVIPKKKGVSDNSATLKMMRVLQDGGAVLLFPEGNRTIAEFQFYITPKLASFIKKAKATLVLYRLSGGTGVRPRFSKKRRKGKFTGEVKKVLKYEEYSLMSDDELMEIIKENLKSFDSFSNQTFKSKKQAEYLERTLFICPKCHKMHTLKSSGEYLNCENCGLSVKYNEHLHFESSDSTFKFSVLNDWYQYQKKVIKETEFKGLIFEDSDVKLYLCIPYKKRELLAKGTIKLTDESLFINDFEVKLIDIIGASQISGKKFSFSTKSESYLVIGKERFNALKYVLLFNKLETTMKKDKLDYYFNLEDVWLIF